MINIRPALLAIGFVIVSGCGRPFSPAGETGAKGDGLPLAPSAELVLTLREVPPGDSGQAGNQFVLRLSNRGPNDLRLDGRVLANPSQWVVIITGGFTVIPELGIPPTPQEMRDEDVVTLKPGGELELSWRLGPSVYEHLKDTKSLIFCYIDGQASRYSPTGKLSTTWQGKAYSNSIIFESRIATPQKQ